MATIHAFTDLEIWKLANEIEQQIFKLTRVGLLSKDFELKDQMNRSSGSIMDNIAEGFGRGGRLELIQFLTIAKGSASELLSQLIRCKNRKYIDLGTCTQLEEQVIILGKKVGAFIVYLNKSSFEGTKFINRDGDKNMLHEDEVEYLASILESIATATRDQRPETINTFSAAKPLGTYPHARKVNNLLFLSGIGSRSAKDNSIPGLKQDAEGNIIAYDIEAECHSVFANVKAVLEASGSSWDKMVDVTVFLTNMKKDFPIYNKVYGEYFEDVQACRTTVEVKSLPTPIAIELKVIATL